LKEIQVSSFSIGVGLHKDLEEIQDSSSSIGLYRDLEKILSSSKDSYRDLEKFQALPLYRLI